MASVVGSKINKLQIGGYLKLADWWKTNYKALIDSRKNYNEAAQLATRELKFFINDDHCRRLAKELELPLSSSYSKLDKEAKARLTERVERLETLVEHLYTKLGEAKPE